MREAKIGWVRLRCECGSQQFNQVFHLIWKEGAGTTHEAGGWECVQCRSFQDSATLTRRAVVDMKKRELHDLQEQVKEEELEEGKAIASHPKG